MQAMQMTDAKAALQILESARLYSAICRDGPCSLIV